MLFLHDAIGRLFTWLKHGHAVVGTAASLALPLALLPLHGQSSAFGEYRSKANYLAKFPNFVEWPAEAWPSEHAPFLICVFGEYPFGTALAEATRGARVRERPVEIRWIRKTGELPGCQILFVSRSEQKRYSKVLEIAWPKIMFTVGETPEFLDAGGMLSFFTQGESLGFDVNLGEVNKARLRISSRMLALARRVVNQAVATKG